MGWSERQEEDELLDPQTTDPEPGNNLLSIN
jgi:hypothetical protein